jgi:hypothetical protein
VLRSLSASFVRRGYRISKEPLVTNKPAADDRYLARKQFLKVFSERYLKPESLARDLWPAAQLDELERKNISDAKRGLKMALDDSNNMAMAFFGR